MLEGPVSLQQEGLWLNSQLQDDYGAYNVPLCLHLQGKLDIDRLRGALDAVIVKHDALRSSLVADSIPPRLRILEPPIVASGFIDFTGSTVSSPGFRAALLEEVQREFPVPDGPFVRAKLFLLGRTEHVLVLTFHHLVIDGWSMAVVLRDLIQAYGRPTAISDPKMGLHNRSYLDYATEQRAWLETDDFARRRKYWANALEGNVDDSLSWMPADSAVPLMRDGGVQPLTIDDRLHSRLREVAREEGVTPHMLLLAAFSLLMSRYEDKSVVSIGTIVSNREDPRFELTVGLFATPLVVRVAVPAQGAIRFLLRATMTAFLRAYENRLPFVSVVQAVRPGRIRSRKNPLFQVTFQLGPDLETVSTTDLVITPLNVHNQRAQFPLGLDLFEGDSALRGVIEHDQALIDEALVKGMASHYLAVVEAITADPSRELSDVSVWTKPSLSRFQSTAAAALPEEGMDFVQAFEKQAQLSPGAQAVNSEDSVLTYDELDQRAGILAEDLRHLGVVREARIPVILERSPEAIVAMLATLKAGAAFVPMDPRSPVDRLRSLVRACDARAIVTTSALLESLEDAPAVLLVDGDNRDLRDWSERPRLSAHPAQLAYVIFTSGSTGRPKGVMITRAALSSYVRAASRKYGLTPRDRVLQLAPLNFDWSLDEIFPALSVGAAVELRSEHMLDAFDLFLEECVRRKVTVLMIPTQLWHGLTRFLLSSGRPLPTSIRLVCIGGEAALPGVVEEWQDLVGPSVRLLNTYGPTEITVEATVCDLSSYGVDPRLGTPIGRPLPGSPTYILDSRGRLAPLGTPGEITIGGERLARGYLSNPKETAASFIPAPEETGMVRLYRTGDIGRWLPDGNLAFLGRLDEQVKIRGYRVEPNEVQTVLSRHPEIHEVAVLAQGYGNGGTLLIAYGVTSDGLVPRDLSSYLESRLPDYMIPARFVPVSTMPLTPNGKIDRSALLARSPRASSSAPVDPPATDTERMMANVWREVLGVEASLEDDFFELGGDSILALVLVSKARQQGVSIELRDVFATPRIRDLVARAKTVAPTISRRHGSAPAPGDVCEQTPMQRWFFTRQLLDPNRYVQGMALDVPLVTTDETVRASLQALTERHPSLQRRFSRVGEGWNVRAVDSVTIPLLVHSISSDERDQMAFARASLMRSAAARIRIEEGILMVGGRLNSPSFVQIVLAVHHLAVDGVSWRILLSELDELIRDTPASPHDGDERWEATSADEWVAILRGEMRRWREGAIEHWGDLETPPLPRDRYEGSNSYGSASRLATVLDYTTVSTLASTLRTSLEAILLATTLRGIADHCGHREFGVAIEGHGRELLPAADLSRTVGWFTAPCPIRVKLAPSGDTLGDVEQVRRELAHLPPRLAYGALRYLSDEYAQLLTPLDSCDLEFNYLGRFDTMLRDEMGRQLTDFWAEPLPAIERPHLVEVTAEAWRGELTVTWEFSQNVHERATIEQWNAGMEAAIQELTRVLDLGSRHH
jgi:amino acid adenylation domain-containing protein/non-ribosomal peptide synthase protein (TIGR01720 family)